VSFSALSGDSCLPDPQQPQPAVRRRNYYATREWLWHSQFNMRPPVCLLGCLLLAPLVLAQKVTIDYDKDADFSRLQRYQWRVHPAFEKSPELRELYSTGIQLVLQAGNRELMKKGLRPSDGPPDVFVTFFLSAKDNQEVRTVTEFVPGGWYGWYGQPTWTRTEVDYHKAGMLVLDIVDAATSKLLWRAYCSDTIKDMRKRDENINSTVKKAFDRFPPKGK
jgi:hypothetical protein